MLPDGRRLGAHLPLGGGMVRAADRAREIGANALQIFIDNPTAWRRRAAPPPELGAFRARLAAYDIAPVAVHASYLVNLAGPEPDFFERSIDLLASELSVAPSFGASFVNVHIGSHRDAGPEAGIRRLAEGVTRVLALTDERLGEREAEIGSSAPDPATQPDAAPMLVLENSAGGGWSLGVDLDELSDIAEAIAVRGVPEGRVGFCLDTAHAWGAGVDVASPDATDAFLSTFRERIGLYRLVMVHLNDSRAELGSRLDRHEHLGAGRIGPVGLAHVIRHPWLAGATYYLETPGMDEGYDAINMARARALATGEPLDDLPGEAFELIGSRARTAPA